MVQKAFLSLILADMEQNYLEVGQQGYQSAARYDADLMSQMAAKNFKNSDAATNTLLMKHFGGHVHRPIIIMIKFIILTMGKHLKTEKKITV